MMDVPMGNPTRWPMEPASPEKEPAAEADRPAGRIVHDARGNAIWGRAAGDSTSTMLKRLELPGLAVEGQEETVAPAAAVKAGTGDTTAAAEVGYNPYDQRKAVKKPTTPKGPVGRRTR